MAISKEFIEKVKAFLEIYPKSHSINSLRNAFNLLEKAKKFQGLDDNISLFCSITAVEEAVSSVFLALKHLGYDASDKVNHYNHIHKAAFFPFCKALTFSFQFFNNSLPQIVIDKDSEYPRLYVRFFVENFDGEKLIATPDTPFGFTIRNDLSFEYFEENLKKYFGEKFEELEKWLKNEANQRNKILYASPKGIPKVEITNPEKYFEDFEQKLNILMLLYFLIAPYREKQVFVQQALYAFVKMLGKVPNEEKLLQMLNDIDCADIICKVDLNSGKLKGVPIDSSVIKEVVYTENGINIKVG